MVLRSLLASVFFLSTIALRAQDPASALEGLWQGWVVEGKGDDPSKGPVKIELKIAEGRIVATDLRGQSKDLGQGTFKLAKKGTLQTIDAVRSSAPGKGQTYLGIWSVEGDILRWCSATPNRERPETFETKRGQYLLIVKRMKK